MAPGKVSAIHGDKCPIQTDKNINIGIDCQQFLIWYYIAAIYRYFSEKIKWIKDLFQLLLIIPSLGVRINC
jgi:hypothetical protein